MKYPIFGFAFCFLILACESGSSPGHQDTDAKTIRFQCDQETDDTGMPHSTVFLSFQDQKIAVTNILACEKIERDQYAALNIPASAIDACGGWYAGAGDYLYIAKDGDQYLIFQTAVYEEDAEGSIGYKLIATLSATGDLEFAFDKKSLEGVYTLGGHDNSWLFDLKEENGQMAGRYYNLEGMLPPGDQWKNLADEFGPPEVVVLEINPYDLSFYSSLGQGQIVIENGNQSIVFFELTSHLEDELTLGRDHSYD